MSHAGFRGLGDELSVDTFDTLQFEPDASALAALHTAAKLRLILRLGANFGSLDDAKLALFRPRGLPASLRLGLEIAPKST